MLANRSSTALPGGFSDYSLLVLLSSSTVTAVGVAAHLFILRICPRVQDEDHKSFLLLQQLTSAIAILGLLTGGLGSLRHEIIKDYTIFFCYGLLKYTKSPRFCAAWDLFPGMHVPLSSLLVTAMVAYRCLGIMGRYVTECQVWVTVLFSILVTCPLAVFTAFNYVDISNVDLLLSQTMQQEAKTVPAFAVDMTMTLSSLFVLYNLINLISLGCGVTTAIYSYFIVQALPKRTTENIGLHKGYFRMLYFETTTMSTYAVVTQLSSSSLMPLSPSVSFYISAFNFVIFSIPTVLQGILTIICVPYFRIRLLPLRHPKDSSSPPSTFDLESNKGDA